MVEIQFQMHRRTGELEIELSKSQASVLALPNNALAAVFGAPGSGKTAVLKAMLVDRIRSGALKNDEVLAIAATRSAATSLRDELALALQSATKGPLARTLASLAFAVVSAKELSLGKAEPELVSGSEQDQLLKEILTDLDDRQAIAWPSSLAESTRKLSGFRAELRDVINVAMEHQISPEQLAKLAGAPFEVWHQVSTVYREYLLRLAGSERNRLDAAGLLHAASDFLAGGFWPPNLAKPKLILVDDAQELTPGAIRLLSELVTGECSLVLFGDPDASTLGFRASDSRAMSILVAELEASGLGVKHTIYLEPREQERPVELREVLAEVAAKVAPDLAGPHRFRPPAKSEVEAAKEQSDRQLQTALFDSTVTEVAWIADRLRYFHLDKGVAWRDMAVVARTRSQLEELELALANHQVPARIGGARSALRDEFGSKSLLAVARAVVAGRPLELSDVLDLLANPFANFSNLQLRRLRRALRNAQDPELERKNSDDLLVELFNDPTSFAEVTSYELKELRKFLSPFQQLRLQHSAKPSGIEDLLWAIFNESAPQRTWLSYSQESSEIAAQANRNLDSITALCAAAKRFAERNPAAAAVDFIDRQLALGLPEDTLVKDARALDWLPLHTPASLIGQRFEVVVLARMVDGIWPNPRQRSSLLGAQALNQKLRQTENSSDELPGELRMLYKSVGAANNHVLATVTESESDMPSQFFQLVLGGLPKPEAYPTGERSLRTMVAKLRRSLVSSFDEEPFKDRANNVLALARLALDGVPGSSPDEWLGILGPSTTERLYYVDGQLDGLIPISPSQLERFITCPLHWFVTYHGGDDTGFEASLGTILHRALELSKLGTAAELETLVDQQWPSLRFEADWLSRIARRKASKIIGNMAEYLSKFKDAGKKLVDVEVDFEFEFGDALIKGSIDRLELDQTGGLTVVDLKTGTKVFTKAEAQNNPQLLTYQLAIEIDPELTKTIKEKTGSEPKLEGAKLLMVGNEGYATRDQDSISKNGVLRSQVNDMLAKAMIDMAQPIFKARVAEHCRADRFGAPCKLQVIEAVTYVE